MAFAHWNIKALYEGYYSQVIPTKKLEIIISFFFIFFLQEEGRLSEFFQ